MIMTRAVACIVAGGAARLRVQCGEGVVPQGVHGYRSAVGPPGLRVGDTVEKGNQGLLSTV